MTRSVCCASSTDRDSHPRANPCPPAGNGGSSRGVTLTELLVAAALALVIMGAVASLFAMFGRSVKRSEAAMSQSSMLRNAAWQLRQDLAGVTCPLTPWLAPESNAGYFELIEGPARDTTRALDAAGRPTAALTADTDDILLFTTQSLAGAFVGRFDGKMIESPYAEVAWFCRPAERQPVPDTTLYDLHRRQLLVVNYLGRADLTDNTLPLSTDRAGCDISLRSGTMSVTSGTVLIPNSLGDVTKRENRFMRSGYTFLTEASIRRSVDVQPFPYAFPLEAATQLARPEAALDGTKRATEDHVLANVIGFDVRVFDPEAAVSGSDGRVPGDPGYVATSVSQPGDGKGAYVDLGWGGGTPAAIQDEFPPVGKTPFQSAGVAVTDATRRATLASPTYDTWSRHYEFNGIDDDVDGTVDEGTSDDSGPKETSPPYPVPLRGIEVRIRCYEPSSKQVRQVTIRHSFVK